MSADAGRQDTAAGERDCGCGALAQDGRRCEKHTREALTQAGERRYGTGVIISSDRFDIWQAAFSAARAMRAAMIPSTTGSGRSTLYISAEGPEVERWATALAALEGETSDPRAPAAPVAPASERPTQYNGQNEPGYPDHETVVFSLRYPDWTVHQASTRCALETPHLIAACGEFEPDTRRGATYYEMAKRAMSAGNTTILGEALDEIERLRLAAPVADAGRQDSAWEQEHDTKALDARIAALAAAGERDADAETLMDELESAALVLNEWQENAGPLTTWSRDDFAFSASLKSKYGETRTRLAARLRTVPPREPCKWCGEFHPHGSCPFAVAGVARVPPVAVAPEPTMGKLLDILKPAGHFTFSEPDVAVAETAGREPVPLWVRGHVAAAAAAIALKDYDEAYHQLYCIADPGFMSLSDPFAALAAPAPAQPKKP